METPRLADLAERYGTPLFIFDRQRTVSNYRNFAHAVSAAFGNVVVYYSIKTNNLPAICTILAEGGANAEISSGLDMHVATLAGFPLEQAIFDGLYKRSEDLRMAIEKGIGLINIESLDELKMIDRFAGLAGKKQDVGLRLNLDLGRRGLVARLADPEWVLDYPTSRFGLSLDEAEDVCKTIKNFENVRLTSLMIHPYYWGTRAAVRFAARVKKQYGVRFEKFNFGGGFRTGTLEDVPISRVFIEAVTTKLGLGRTQSRRPDDIEEVAHRLHSEITRAMKEFGVEFPTFCFEPGRYLVGDAGSLLLRVVLVKKSKHGSWVVVDGGTNLLFGGYLERRRIVLVNRKSESPPQKMNIAGPLLYRNDIIALRQDLPALEVGDLVAVLDAGAYNLTRSTQFMHPRPPVLIMNGEKEKLVRMKEEYDEVLGRQGGQP